MHYSLTYYIRKLVRLLVWYPVMLIAKIWPRNTNLIAFGAWTGDFFIDNPKYFLLYVLEHSNFKCIWIGKEEIKEKIPVHPRLRFQQKGSLSAVFSLLRAKTWICCQGIGHDFTKMPLCGNALLINFWHGIPLKYIGGLSPFARNYGKEPWFSTVVKRLTYLPPCWLTASSLKMGGIFPKDSPDLFSKDKILYYGTPRNDFLICHKNDAVLKRQLHEKYSKILGFPIGVKIICYLPTWRRSGDYVKTFYGLTDEEQIKWKNMLESQNAILIEKHHYRTYEDYPVTKKSQCSITIMPEMQGEIDVQELLLITDILISDYSGAYIDYGILKRPCIHFAHDLENYKMNDSGLIYNYEDVVAGPIVKSFLELFNEVQEKLKNPRFCPADDYTSLIEYEKGDACKKTLEFICKMHKKSILQ